MIKQGILVVPRSRQIATMNKNISELSTITGQIVCRTQLHHKGVVMIKTVPKGSKERHLRHLFGEMFSQHAHLIRMNYLEDLTQRVHRTKTVLNSVVEIYGSSYKWHS